MGEFKVTESGWYCTRDGREAEVIVFPTRQRFNVYGYIFPCPTSESWDEMGFYDAACRQHQNDLVEYLGKERPKQKKVVRMAPSLFRLESNRFGTSTWLYQSEEHARQAQGDSFVRWLIDTPLAIEVEVPDNG